MSVAHVSSEISFLEAIKARPHWHVVLHPQVFEERRLGSRDEMWSCIKNCRVSLRERDYPHVYEDCDKGADWVASWGESAGQSGYWRFFQSGQLVHRISFFEDRLRLQGSPPPFLDFLEVLFTVTEIFEFSARLANRAVFGPSASVTVELLRIVGRKLLTEAHPPVCYETRGALITPTLECCWAGQITELAGRSAELALEQAKSFFGGFGGSPVSDRMLTERQRRFLERT